MEMKEIIEKINNFSKLARERELTEEEKKERQEYRKIYLEKFKAQVRGHLDNIKIVDENDENENKLN
ncbi:MULTISPECIES: DUF896 domain-containing protein [Fusobacterium]|uniref:DUF896 domain-containing protein n=1 Tax=Fusobacterium hominis TaxID=2764326 RepID=A0A7G9GY95_9FUSO|nr:MULTISPECIES: DUF896 domain-containing protein [Fusobacterium]QNM15777.1 DUF896 domain-containing protein [Fusobacterium hominis]